MNIVQDKSQSEIIKERRDGRLKLLEDLRHSIDSKFIHDIEKHINTLIIKRSVNMSKLYRDGIQPGMPEYDSEYEVYFELMMLLEWINRRGNHID